MSPAIASAPPPPTGGPEARARLPEIDVLKAVCIAVIPLIHSLRPVWDANVSSLERWLLYATRFAVPGFLFASGYLAAGEVASASRVGARLRRLIVPYTVATLAVEVFSLSHGAPVTAGSAALDLVFGSALGPYYYVFVAVLLTLAWPLIAAARAEVRALLVAGSLACQVYVELGLVRDFSIPWVIRNPLLWGAYFLWGFTLRGRRDRLEEWLLPRRRIVESCLLLAEMAALAFLAWAPPAAPAYLVAWLDVYVTIALVLVVSTRWRAVPRAVRQLSDVGYFIYLYHLLVIQTLHDPARGSPAAFGWVAVVSSWWAGILVPVAAAALLRRALGPRARLLFGA